MNLMIKISLIMLDKILKIKNKQCKIFYKKTK